MSTVMTAHVGTTAFTVERSALGQVAEYDVYAHHAAECEGHPADEFHPMGETVYCDGTCAQASDREYLGGGSKREARAIFNRAVRAAEKEAG